jgi:hypothetical protein
VVNELNDFLNNVTGSNTVVAVSESIHTRGRILPRRFYSNDTESYLALHEYMKRLCGRRAVTGGETFDHETQSIMVVKKKQTEKKSKSAATAAATASVVPLTKDEVCHLYELVVPHQSVSHETIENLRKYVKDNSIQFRLTDAATETFKQLFSKSENSESEGGGNMTKMSNTRKRKPHKRGRTKRYRRYKNKSLKNKSLKNKSLKNKSLKNKKNKV